MKHLLLLFWSLAFIPRLVFADLGDTIASAQSKYGEPSMTKTAQILAYLHGTKYRVWQSYVDNVCVIAQFALVDGGPLTTSDCRELDHDNLPAGLTPGVGQGWERITWPNTVSYQYTGPEQQLYQVMESWDKTDGYSRMYLHTAGIAFIKALGR
jgi:hypothetical protein